MARDFYNKPEYPESTPKTVRENYDLHTVDVWKKEKDGTKTDIKDDEIYRKKALSYLASRKNELSETDCIKLERRLFEYLKMIDVDYEDLDKKFEEFFDTLKNATQNRLGAFKNQAEINLLASSIQSTIDELSKTVEEMTPKGGALRDFLNFAKPENMLGLSGIVNSILYKSDEYSFADIFEKGKGESFTEAKLDTVRKLLDNYKQILTGFNNLCKGVQEGKNEEELMKDVDIQKFFDSPEGKYIIDLQSGVSQKDAQNIYLLNKAEFYKNKFQFGGESLSAIYYDKIIDNKELEGTELRNKAKKERPSKFMEILTTLGNELLSYDMLLITALSGPIGQLAGKIGPLARIGTKVEHFANKNPWGKLLRILPGVTVLESGGGGMLKIGRNLVINIGAELGKFYAYHEFISRKWGEEAGDIFLMIAIFMPGAIEGFQKAKGINFAKTLEQMSKNSTEKASKEFEELLQRMKNNYSEDDFRDMVYKWMLDKAELEARKTGVKDKGLTISERSELRSYSNRISDVIYGKVKSQEVKQTGVVGEQAIGVAEGQAKKVEGLPDGGKNLDIISRIKKIEDLPYMFKLRFKDLNIMGKYIKLLEEKPGEVLNISEDLKKLISKEENIPFIGFLKNFVLKELKDEELKESFIKKCIQLENNNKLIELTNFIEYTDIIIQIQGIEKIPTDIFIKFIEKGLVGIELIKKLIGTNFTGKEYENFIKSLKSGDFDLSSWTEYEIINLLNNIKNPKIQDCLNNNWFALLKKDLIEINGTIYLKNFEGLCRGSNTGGILAFDKWGIEFANPNVRKLFENFSIEKMEIFSRWSDEFKKLLGKDFNKLLDEKYLDQVLGKLKDKYLKNNFGNDEIIQLEGLLREFVNKKRKLVNEITSREGISPEQIFKEVFPDEFSKLKNPEALTGKIQIEIKEGTPVIYLEDDIYNIIAGKSSDGLTCTNYIYSTDYIYIRQSEIIGKEEQNSTLIHELSHAFDKLFLGNYYLTPLRKVQSEIRAYLSGGQNFDDLYRILCNSYLNKYSEIFKLSYQETMSLQKQIFYALEIVKKLQKVNSKEYINRIMTTHIRDWGKLLDYYVYGRNTYSLEIQRNLIGNKLRIAYPAIGLEKLGIIDNFKEEGLKIIQKGKDFAKEKLPALYDEHSKKLGLASKEELKFVYEELLKLVGIK